jgi:NitT/TauT family transport system substrate-binding protein
MPSIFARSMLPLALALTFAVSPPALALDKLTVQMAFYPQGPQAYLFLAKENGWFETAGLDVDLLDGRGSNYSMQVVSSGHADIGEGQLAPIAAAREKGARAKVIAEWFKTDGPAIIVPKDSAIQSPTDLKGKKAVLIASGPWPPILDSFFKIFGMTQQDLSLIYVDSTALFTTYATGGADAMLSVDLAYTEADPLRASRLMSAANYGVKLPGDGLFATEDTIAKRRDVLVRFLKVSRQAIDYIYAGHEEEAAEAIRKIRPDTKLDAERLHSQIVLYGPLRPSPATQDKPTGWQSNEDWQQRIDFMRQAQMLKSAHTPDEFFDNSLLEAGLQSGSPQ